MQQLSIYRNAYFFACWHRGMQAGAKHGRGVGQASLTIPFTEVNFGAVEPCKEFPHVLLGSLKREAPQAQHLRGLPITNLAPLPAPARPPTATSTCTPQFDPSSAAAKAAREAGRLRSAKLLATPREPVVGPSGRC